MYVSLDQFNTFLLNKSIFFQTKYIELHYSSITLHLIYIIFAYIIYDIFVICKFPNN